MEKVSCPYPAEYELVVVAENSKLSSEIPPKTRLEWRLALFQRQKAKKRKFTLIVNHIHFDNIKFKTKEEMNYKYLKPT